MEQENISLLNVNEMVAMLSKAYISLIEKDIPFRKFPSVMLWGPPGVGKSQGVRQIADAVEARTGKKVKITDVRLLLFNPIDLRGIPTANADKTLAVWLKPQIFQMDESRDVVNILFLDEISAAPQSVQAAAYQITLDRTVGEHKLPENCIVIAAGNRVSDKSVAFKMPRALANRLCHFEIEVNAESWHEWAINSGVNEKVCGFIDYKPNLLLESNESASDLAYATPRSWEMVSNILNSVSDNVVDVLPLIVGCIGSVSAYEFLLWTEVYNKTPDVDDIFSGATEKVPTRPEILYALTSKIYGAVKKHMKAEEINNLIAYAEKLPIEFKSRVYTDLLKQKKIYPILQNNKNFNYWYLRNGNSWDD